MSSVNDLFDNALAGNVTAGGGAPNVPLAERLRPQSLTELVGQTHLLGPRMPE